MKLDSKSAQALIENKLNYVITSTIPTITSPIISKGKDWIRVNDILITKKLNSYKVMRKGITLVEFFKCSWALSYAVALSQSDFLTCISLDSYNKKLVKYLEEIERYSYHLDKSKVRGDISKENIISDRLSRTIREYSLLMDEASPLIKINLDD